MQLCLHLPHLPSPLFLSLCWSPKVGNPSDTTEQTANDAARSFKVSNCRSEEEEEEEGGAAGHENWQGPLDGAGRQRRLRVRGSPGVARVAGETLPLHLGVRPGQRRLLLFHPCCGVTLRMRVVMRTKCCRKGGDFGSIGSCLHFAPRDSSGALALVRPRCSGDIGAVEDTSAVENATRVYTSRCLLVFLYFLIKQSLHFKN